MLGFIDNAVYSYRLKKGNFDEADKKDAFVVFGYERMGKIWPFSDEYRIVEYENRTLNRYGLQAKINDSYVDVLYYDDGWDDYGSWPLGNGKKYVTDPLGRFAS